MRFGRVSVLVSVLGLSLLLPWIGSVSAQSNWPNRPLTMVVGFAAGGGTDVLGRIIGRKLSEVSASRW